MDAVRTCLLITDDPDDHQSFSEAISRIDEKAVVIIVIDGQKALSLMESGTHHPDFILVDLANEGIEKDNTFDKIKEVSRSNEIPLFAYGIEHHYLNIHDLDGIILFPKDFEYSALQAALKQFLNSAK